MYVLTLHCLTHELPCAGEIIKIWSRSVHANVNIGHLWMALTKMERSDVKRELKAQIVKDCMAVKDFQFSKGSEDVQLITRRGVQSPVHRQLSTLRHQKPPPQPRHQASLIQLSPLGRATGTPIRRTLASTPVCYSCLSRYTKRSKIEKKKHQIASRQLKKTKQRRRA